jgi:4-hydroxybenzoate polyprenyltransferase
MILILAARETLMDLRDREGDRIGARDTIATVFGARAAKSTSSVLLLSGAALLCSVLLVQVVHLTVPSALAAAVAVCLILGLTLTPAYGAIRPDAQDRDQHGAIQSFLGWSRAAMLLLPLLNLFLWRG